jgi:amino acid transporter
VQAHDPTAPRPVAGSPGVQSTPAAPSAETGQYKPQLRRELGVLGAVALTVSGITPTASIFIDAPVAFSSTGSGVFWSFAIAAVIALGLGFCYAELGTMFPVAGGLYSVVARVLGGPAGFLGFVDYLILAIVGPAAVGLGTAQYVGVFWPTDNAKLVGAVLILGTTIMAMLSIKGNAVVTGLFLAVEMTVVATLIVLGATHLNQPITVLLQPQTYTAGDQLAVVSLGAILAGVVIALGSYNGYDAPITFSEEMKNPRRDVSRAVLISLTISVLCQFLPITAVVLGSPSLEQLTTSPVPMSYFIQSVGGKTIDDLITIGVILAIVNSAIVGMLALGRLVYSSGRDRAWPDPINGWLSYVSPRTQTPVVATGILGCAALLMSLFVNLATVVQFASVLLVFMYVLVAASAIVSRFSQRDHHRPYRMPLWPLPPILALLGCAIVISQQSPRELAIVAGIFGVAGLYYAVFLRPRAQTHWVMLNPTVPGDPPSAANTGPTHQA